MPRANRYIVSGQIYHVTHRCHDRSFLFKFGKDRDAYRAMLRARVKRFPIQVLGYCLTSNHTHLLLKVDGLAHEVLARFMQTLEGDFAQYYNLRKKRKGAFWSDRYHAVMIDGGEYLWRCLRYIDLNMVRAGAVASPADWEWCGYHEIVGLRKRYRLLDREALAEALAPDRGWEDVSRHYAETVREALHGASLRREACWTESLAVGGKAFTESMSSRIPNRIAVEQVQTDGLWLVREVSNAYSAFSPQKRGSKGTKRARLHV